ncbi:energy transducer TonB [Phaeobacter sp. LSS9]|uniref:energy transducer TonB n=1 Tax=unclassified Phaeobacter TaxID=2621772 RepID=UPI000E46A4ED|nr:energy transducer TonB [Phaeobacter sp. LSS9]AXT36373.1 energy transducer TonB [Phaeobacter sp. LSS9]
MQTGTKISLAGHGLLAGWVVFGAWFPSEPLPLAVQDVAIISTEEFARLSQQRAAPVVADTARDLSQPDPDPAPEVTPPTPPAPEPQITQPEPVTVPDPDPELTERPEPQPVEPTPPVAAPSPPDVPDSTSVTPQLTERPQLRPVDRVAPTPVAPPEPDTQIADVAQPEVSDEVGTEPAQEAQQATAEAAANDRIVTEEVEAETEQVASAAPAQSLRPRRRPDRPTPAAQPEPEPASESETGPEPEPADPATDPTPDRADAVEDALAAALAGGGEVEAPEPSGPPLTSGEKDALRVAVQQCWNVGSLSSEALRTTVVVSVALTQDGRPEEGSIRMLSSTGGSGSAANQAFGAARRAILRCGARGFQLPSDKYAQWRNIEMTFNPERMRIK